MALRLSKMMLQSLRKQVQCEFNRCCSNSSFKNKVVLITGASSGIGEATAISFSKNGASLALAGRNKERLDKVASACKKNGADTIQLVGDLTDDTYIKQMVPEMVSKFSKLDVLINNAGSAIYKSYENTTIEDYDIQMRANIRAYFYLSQLCIPHLAATKGNIVNISSMSGRMNIPNTISYSIAKAGIDHFTSLAALELSPKGIRVNAVSPGVIYTPMFDKIGLSREEAEQLVANVTTSIPINRVGKPEEIADSVLFLASEKASYITGANLLIDGGITLLMVPQQ